ncbi:MAG: glycosyltransferase [Pseudomonadota bacterium]
MQISVALCTYNGERFLQAQLGSLLRQTLRPHEVVVGDDGSTDRTVELLARFAHADGYRPRANDGFGMKSLVKDSLAVWR